MAKSLKEQALDYTKKMNDALHEHQAEKIAERSKNQLEEDKIKYENFKQTHNIPLAGDLPEKTNENKNNKKHVFFSNETTFYGSETKSGLPYESIKPFIKSFDLIGFHGGDGVSNFIAKVQNKMAGHDQLTERIITHTGLAIRAEDFPESHYLYRPPEENRLYIWESTMSGPLAFDGINNIDGNKCQFCKICNFGYCCAQNEKCSEHMNFNQCVPSVPHRFGFLGSQFRDMDVLTVFYDSNPNAILVWARLDDKNRKIANNLLASPKNLENLVNAWNGLAYNSTCCCVDLCAAALPFFRIFQDLYTKCCPVRVGNNGSQFCSEFCANIYKTIGILDDNVVANKVVPADFLTVYDEDFLNERRQQNLPSIQIRQKSFKNSKNLPVTSADVDKALPILFRSYIKFTARSRLGNKIFLNKGFLDELKPLPDFLDETVIDEKAIDQEATMRSLRENNLAGTKSINHEAFPSAGRMVYTTETIILDQPKPKVIHLPYPFPYAGNYTSEK